MSNLALGIALGSSMNSINSYGDSIDIDMPAWIAIILVVTLALFIITTIVMLYVRDSDFLESHWERCILGPIVGLCLWSCVAIVVSLFAWLFSFIL